jgi:hypothetical protein
MQEMNNITRRENINWKCKLILLWAILFHDIWKEYAFTQWKDGENHYYDHDNIWAEIFKQRLAQRLKLPNDFTQEIYFIIKNHMRIFNIPSMKVLKARKLMIHGYFNGLLLVHEADEKWKKPQNLDNFNQILDIYINFKSILATKKFLTGRDILARYPSLRGREIWKKLQQLNDQVLETD